METVVLPTTLMGRHPGWGKPGGGSVATEHLAEMWDAISEQNLAFDAVLTGYMGERGHIDLSARIIQSVKATKPKAKIWVDPVMGDHGSLYIPEARANAIRDKLVPLADCLTPNLWELSWLSGQTLTSSHAIRTSTAAYDTTLVTSVPDGDKIGAVWTSGQSSLICSHDKFASVPHGGGDSLAAILLAHHLRGEDEATALKTAVGSIFDIMQAANAVDAGELPLVRCQAALTTPKPLDVRHYD